jgi:uncharacterized damage-inducible protein DinB
MSAVEEVVRLWEVFRQGTVAELENIPEEQWDYRPGAGARSLRELALHVAVSGLGFTAELLAPDTQFARLRDPEVQAKYMEPYANATSKADIVDVLKSTGADIIKRLRDAAGTLEQQTMSSMSGEQSRASGISFAAAHEMYHRGQIATYARAVGVVPAITQRTGYNPARR